MLHLLPFMSIHIGLPLAAAAEASKEVGANAGKAIALGVGAGGGAAGAGAGIGMLFGKVIEATTRQPEMKDEITSIQWLGFALTEAAFFYSLGGGVNPFFLEVKMHPLASLPSTPIAASSSWLITPNVGLMVWILVVFAISLYILKKVVFPRITAALGERRVGIEESIEAAERTRLEADKVLAEYRERLKE